MNEKVGGTVADVLEYVEKNPNERAQVLAAEEASDKPRKGVLEGLDPLEALLVDGELEDDLDEEEDVAAFLDEEAEEVEIDPELEPQSNGPEYLNEVPEILEDPEFFAVSYAPGHVPFDPTPLYDLLGSKDDVVLVPTFASRTQRSYEVLGSTTLILVAGWTSNVNCNVDLLLARTHGRQVLEFSGGELKRSLATPQMIQIQNNMNRSAFPLNADK